MSQSILIQKSLKFSAYILRFLAGWMTNLSEDVIGFTIVLHLFILIFTCTFEFYLLKYLHERHRKI